MFLSRTGLYPRFIIVAFMVACGLTMSARGADGDAALRQRALKLNDLTGNDAIEGEIAALNKDPEETKKLLVVALELAKAKDQPFNVNASYVLARCAAKVHD